MDTHIKQEKLSTTLSAGNKTIPPRDSEVDVIDLNSCNDEGNGSEIGENNNGMVDIESGGDSKDVSVVVGAKRARSDSVDSPVKKLAIVIPEEEKFGESSIVPIRATPFCNFVPPPSSNTCKQFWKAGDYEGSSGGDWEVSAGGFDHVRVHPKFLHSNATSHKWSLGAFAELLDNALDEVHSGATYVNVDMIHNKKDGNKMVLIEDSGGGMNPDTMRHCMSLGYSAKSKLANTIGQYGNGFKTSTMRLGADVIVFSRCSGKDGKSPTQSIGLLSYTFLTSTGKEDIVVPMLDYERRDSEWCPIVRSSVGDWEKNVETVVQWSPYTSQEDLLRQFNLMKRHGTKIIIYNLWEDDEGMLELDFDTDPYDIQLRGVNRDEKNIDMASSPGFKHAVPKHAFLTWVASHNCLSTLDRISSWNSNINPTCKLCSSSPESRNHLFFEYPYARQVWTALTLRLLGNNFSTSWLTLIQLLTSPVLNSETQFLLRLVFQSSLYHIWRERNRRHHDNIKTSPRSLITDMGKMIRNRINALQNQDDRRIDTILDTWINTRS